VGRMDGKVVLITGAARGQGRAHALRLAEEGADIIAVDACTDVGSAPYPLATEDDLAETAKLVEDLDRRIVTRRADVRDYGGLEAAVDEGVSELGRLDVVCANAGILSFGPLWELTDEQWQDMIDINLTGVWHTVKAVVPTLIDQGEGGSIILTSSVAGLKGFGYVGAYSAAKHGVVGLMRTLLNEVSAHNIRVNCVNPTTVDTDMIQNPAAYGYFGVDNRDDFAAVFQTFHTLPLPWIETGDVSSAVLYLASDDSRYVTGLTLAVDGGFLNKVG
jgi:SDR family mycofactocin-dependent oxidoreductase